MADAVVGLTRIPEAICSKQETGGAIFRHTYIDLERRREAKQLLTQ